ncbi:unnamed protein product [Rhizoctonia solani]|uniref:F-box domain-containing protein n=1 Tax=Rhizoctonia solani TaxID=456999 RepID=A0A8H3B1Y0_9AGAM|nr:unnamed protein product [Rhizoctonia solani]
MSIESPACLAVQRWEDAHSHLLSALTTYMDTCTSLKHSPLAGLATHTEDLIPRIERHITSLGSFVACQVSETRSILSTTRNQLVSRIYALPEEVLVEIFTRVIYLTDKSRQPMERALKTLYRHLHSLTEVCSSWRNIAIRRKDFWSIVPVIEKCECSGQLLEEVTERSLRRSSGAGLYVAIDSSHQLRTLLRPLISHGNHIKALNVRTKSRYTMKGALFTLPVFSLPGTLSELSIYLKPGAEYELPTDLDCEIIELPLQHQENFKRIFSSLRALRIRVAHIDLYDVSFANLVELRLEDIRLGDQLIFKRLLGTISSALNLQYLHLAAVSSITSHHHIISHDDDLPSISLPNLKQVYLSDMWFYDLKAIFESFVPGHEKWMLSVPSYCIDANLSGLFPEITTQRLGLLLKGFNIDTLMLRGEGDENYLDGSKLSQLLRAVPTMTTLEMHGWYLDRLRLKALTHSLDFDGAEHTPFPCIHNLHIYHSRITDGFEEGIRAVVTSHKIQQLWLGGFSTSTSGDDSRKRTITDGDDIVGWLASNVLDFQLMGCYDTPESAIRKWCLW